MLVKGSLAILFAVQIGLTTTTSLTAWEKDTVLEILSPTQGH